MFLGTYRHHVDPKGRVAIPAQFRRGLASGSVVALGSEGRLVIHPAEQWREVQARFQITASTPPDERTYIRFLYGTAREMELDGQGRLLLATDHRRFAGVADRAVFTGLGNKVEIVGEPRWDGEFAALTPESFTALGDRLHTPAPGSPGGAPQ